MDRLIDGGLTWDRVVDVRDTGITEPIFDLEVRPNGRKVENFLAGSGGVFVSNTAGFIDPGFSGHITLELANVATLPITLYPGMKIGQLSFMQMTTPADVPYGAASLGSKYQGRRGPTPSRYYENFKPTTDQRSRSNQRFVWPLPSAACTGRLLSAEDDPAAIVALAREAGFGHLTVVNDGQLSSTPMPFLISDDASVLRGHLARPNPGGGRRRAARC